MPENKDDIIRQLRQDILPLEGYRPPTSAHSSPALGLGPIEQAFPGGLFPTGVIHDFINQDEDGLGATSAFIAAVLGRLMERGGIAVWIGAPGSIFAGGLPYYGVDPDRIIFVAPGTNKKMLWAMEESLRCDRFIAVVAEITELSFIQSRRLQLVVEQSRVTGILLRYRPRGKMPVACVAQWRITALPTQSQGDRPGRGFPHWQVELLKIRNRRPMTSEVEWTGVCFRPITAQTFGPGEQQSKTG